MAALASAGAAVLGEMELKTRALVSLQRTRSWGAEAAGVQAHGLSPWALNQEAAPRLRFSQQWASLGTWAASPSSSWSPLSSPRLVSGAL